MLLKVNGASVLMLLLLRSLSRCKHTVSAHRQTKLAAAERSAYMHARRLGRLHGDARMFRSVQGYASGTYTSDSCLRAASSLGTDVSILPSK